MPVTGQRVVRRALGRRLTKLRVANGKSRREVAEAKLGISEPTLHRIETGKVPVTGANVRALCWLYGADQSVTDALAELALGTSREEWWDGSPVIPDWFKLYVGLEASASKICTYDGEIIPGELQTEQYALAVFGAEQPRDDEAVHRQVKLRMQRQRALLARAPQLVTVLGEGALTRPVGGKTVLDGQIEHLRRTAKRDNVEIRVLPFTVGAHAAMAGAFRILDFDDPDDPDVVYLESHVGALYLEEEHEVAEYRRVFDLVSRASVPLENF
ncbi:transcriptional regulator [Asanoa ishikariensis]|uniref:Helix-turn-helix domain-containing protein n=1 Tax=Asanoa ishikariensis TaxID=137265 RepID=A0A1H3N4M0_9ACTN|nr:helix-turn-helix transcriptional regulator [Asanoa ishikariensis]GIF68860.1 transcriptional regulator [Asanoa ishikariensis]SDY83714.1 Helix-turn-helix domain-containing protein [Asanoa ishikariensis]